MFGFALRLVSRRQMIDSVHSLVSRFGLSENPTRSFGVTHASIKANGMCLHPSPLSFLCDVCDFTELAYFTQCLQRRALWLEEKKKSVNKKKKCI